MLNMSAHLLIELIFLELCQIRLDTPELNFRNFGAGLCCPDAIIIIVLIMTIIIIVLIMTMIIIVLIMTMIIIVLIMTMVILNY